MREVDLSVGGVHAPGVTVGAVCTRDGWSPWAAAAAVLVLSALLGAGNAITATYVGLAAVLAVAFFIPGDPTIGQGYELSAIAAHCAVYAAAQHAQVGLMRGAARECAAARHPRRHPPPGLHRHPFVRRIETAATGQPSEHAAGAFDAMTPWAGTRHPRSSPAPCSTSRATTRASPPEPPSWSTAA